jgi:hypothetical protein
MLLNAKRHGVEHDPGHYKAEYCREVLDKLDIAEVLSDLQGFYPGVDSDDLTLLCFEAPEKPCHRHWVAEWLREHGIPCEEVK